ncbi:hypothetical protein PR202_gb13683 [Eleusine coracana subsp. coracana]|uniref:Protein kinase domain-containing protein n=1 Tax=Eleusine coracana subsp. coracana TaxID=191504 RepID=A0AAV5ET22_ELECO|nr:hypothetical protein PR202_gb13683 [Eleusine coracana subsp. coracana]
MTPKITDFGLALGISSEDDDVRENHVIGTKGYIAPECFFTGAVTIKCDVYAFGATLLAIITARCPYRVSNTEHKTSYLAPYIALLCVQENPDDRPTMSDVIMMLKCENMTLRVPRPPGTFSSLASGNETSGSSTYSSAEEFMAEEEESLSYFSCRSSDVDDNDTSIVT